MASNRSGRLAEAAEELAKAALAEADNSSLAVGREAVAGLKQLSSDSAAVKESIDQKLNTNNQKLDVVNASILTMTSEIQSLKNAIQAQDKFQRISFGIQNSHAGSFNYTNRKFSRADASSKQIQYGASENSSDLVRIIPLWCQRDFGCYPGRCAVGLDSSCSSSFQTMDNANAAEQKFRDNIVEQIFALTGTKPRIDKEDDGRFFLTFNLLVVAALTAMNKNSFKKMR